MSVNILYVAMDRFVADGTEKSPIAFILCMQSIMNAIIAVRFSSSVLNARHE